MTKLTEHAAAQSVLDWINDDSTEIGTGSIVSMHVTGPNYYYELRAALHVAFICCNAGTVDEATAFAVMRALDPSFVESTWDEVFVAGDRFVLLQAATDNGVCHIHVMSKQS